MIRDNYLNPEVKKQIDEFNDKLNTVWTTRNSFWKTVLTFLNLDWDDDNHNYSVITNHGITPSDYKYGDMRTDNRPAADDKEAIDKYLTCELIMDVGSVNKRKGRVTKRSRGNDGQPIGVVHNNPLFDTR